MTEYKIVRAEEMSVLEKMINNKLEEGWNLKGDLVVCGCFIMQAMVRAKL